MNYIKKLLGLFLFVFCTVNCTTAKCHKDASAEKENPTQVTSSTTEDKDCAANNCEKTSTNEKTTFIQPLSSIKQIRAALEKLLPKDVTIREVKMLDKNKIQVDGSSISMSTVYNFMKNIEKSGVFTRADVDKIKDDGISNNQYPINYTLEVEIVTTESLNK